MALSHICKKINRRTEQRTIKISPFNRPWSIIKRFIKGVTTFMRETRTEKITMAEMADAYGLNSLQMLRIFINYAPFIILCGLFYNIIVNKGKKVNISA